MGTKRYLFTDHGGPSVTISFRVPEVAKRILDELLPEAEGVENVTQFMQDAFVKAIMLEELERTKRNENNGSGQIPTQPDRPD
jgi:isochorismate hydrolase